MGGCGRGGTAHPGAREGRHGSSGGAGRAAGLIWGCGKGGMAHPGVREGRHGSSGGADRAAWLMPRMRRFTQLNLELSDLPSSHPAVCSYSFLHFLHFLHSLPSYTADRRSPRERLDYMGVLPSYTSFLIHKITEPRPRPAHTRSIAVHTPYAPYLPTLPTCAIPVSGSTIWVSYLPTLPTLPTFLHFLLREGGGGGRGPARELTAKGLAPGGRGRQRRAGRRAHTHSAANADVLRLAPPRPAVSMLLCVSKLLPAPWRWRR